MYLHPRSVRVSSDGSSCRILLFTCTTDGGRHSSVCELLPEMLLLVPRGFYFIKHLALFPSLIISS